MKRKVGNFWERNFGGHWNFGPMTIYGENAMHWAINIRCFGGHLCFRLPLRCYGVWWPLYLYWSEDATPPDGYSGRNVRGWMIGSCD